MNFIQQLSQQTDVLFAASQESFPLVLKIIGILWVVQITNAFFKNRLLALGILPRHPVGLVGILFSPFIHVGFGHLMMNTPPLAILMLMVLMYGKLLFYQVSLFIIGVSGLLIWLFARKGLHVGASGMVMGYWGFTLMNAYQHFSLSSVILAVLCLYYFAGLYINLFPTEKTTSWEAHAFGFLAGVGASLFF